jgi:hypothetical protein
MIRNLYQKEYIALLVILSIAIILRLYFFVGASIEDDLGFTGCAYGLYSGEYDYTTSDQSLRCMVYLPISCLYMTFNDMGLISTHFYHFFCSIVTILTSFFLARCLFGFKAAVYSSLFLTFIPLHIIYSSRIMPSLPETAWGGVAIFLFVLNIIKKRNGFFLKSFQHINFSVGLLIGIAYLCRETGIILLGIPILYICLEIFSDPKNGYNEVKSVLCIISGFLLVVFVESLICFSETGDLFYRWHIVKKAQNVVGPSWTFYFESLLNMQDIDIKSLNIHFLDPHFSPLGISGIIIVMSLIIFLLLNYKKPGRIIIIWFLCYFLFLSFGCSKINPYTPIRKFFRYEILFLTPSSIACGYLFARIDKKGIRRILVLIVFMVLLMSSLIYTRFNYERYHAFHKGASSVYSLIRNYVNPSLPIFLDVFECAIFDYWDKYQSVYLYREKNYFKEKNTTGAYVLSLKDYQGCYWFDYDEKIKVPAHWIKIGASELDYWEYFKPGFQPVLFYVPPNN